MAERGLLDLVQSMVGLVFIMHHVLRERYSRQREELIRCLLALSCVHPTFLSLLSTMLAEAILPAAVGERDAHQSWVSKQQLAAQSTEDMPAHINCLQRFGPTCIVEVRAHQWMYAWLDLEFSLRIAQKPGVCLFGRLFRAMGRQDRISRERCGKGQNGIGTYVLLLLTFRNGERQHRTVLAWWRMRSTGMDLARIGKPAQHYREMVRGLTLYAHAADMPGEDVCSTRRLRRVVCIRTGLSLGNTTRWGLAASHAPGCFDLLTTSAGQQIVRTPSHDPQTTSTLTPISPEAMSFFTFREA